LRLESESDVVKYLILFDNSFNIIGGKAILHITMEEVWNAYYFKIGLSLGKTQNFNLTSVDIVYILDVMLYNFQVGL